MILQGWDTSNVQGWASQLTLETQDGETYTLHLTQVFRLPDRATAEIMGSLLRTEGEEHKKAVWQTWGPKMIEDFEAGRVE